MLLVWVPIVLERAKSSILPNGNFREFFLWRGGGICVFKTGIPGGPGSTWAAWTPTRFRLWLSYKREHIWHEDSFRESVLPFDDRPNAAPCTVPSGAHAPRPFAPSSRRHCSVVSRYSSYAFCCNSPTCCNQLNSNLANLGATVEVE